MKRVDTPTRDRGGCFGATIIIIVIALLAPSLAHATYTALKANDLLDSIGNGATGNTAEMITDMQYTGIRNVRGGAPGDINEGIALYNATGVKTVIRATTGPSPNLAASIANWEKLAAAGALLAIEGPNEPNNFSMCYNGACGGHGYTTWLPIAQWMRDVYAAVHADPKLAGIPVWSPSEVGGELDNVGLQCLVLDSSCAGASSVTLMPQGTKYADFVNIHNYVSGHSYSFVDNRAWSAENPGQTPDIDDLYDNQGHTWAKGFNGYSTDQLLTVPRVTTESGWPTAPAPGAISEDKQGKLYVNLYLDAYKRGWAHTQLFTLKDSGAFPGWGIYHLDGTPKKSADYIHNLTTILADNSSGFTPGALNYMLTPTVATVHSMLLQKSSGVYELAVWGESAKAVASPVTVDLGKMFHAVRVYDTTMGIDPVASYADVSSVPLTLSDHAFIIEMQ